MPTACILLCLVLIGITQRVGGDDPLYRPLWLYQGSWLATKKTPEAGSITNTIVNDCAIAGRFFGCQQTVNGKPGALIIFVPAPSPGDYYTQVVLPDGQATGRGQLHIDGDRWTYSSTSEHDGRKTFRRTTNVFSGDDRIQVEQSESSDGQHWTITAFGEEVRAPTGKQ